MDSNLDSATQPSVFSQTTNKKRKYSNIDLSDLPDDSDANDFNVLDLDDNDGFRV